MGWAQQAKWTAPQRNLHNRDCHLRQIWDEGAVLHRIWSGFMKQLIAASSAFALCLALTACGKADVELNNASVEDVVKATSKSGSINPGQWAVSSEILAVDMPGMPAKEKEMMAAMTKAMVGQKTVNESCISPEQAAKPNAEMFAANGGGSCTFETFTIFSGKMNAVMDCAAPGGAAGKMHLVMSGQYGGDSYDITSEIKMSGMPSGSAAGGMTITSRSSGKRSGACKALTKAST
jgi:Protein of unknown function (DUF3617)